MYATGKKWLSFAATGRRPTGLRREASMIDIAILGNGVAANLAAAYFRKNMPELAVAVIGSGDKRRPIVGEALVEASTNFIREIGLGPLLIERHYPKYGLTYYYKPDLDDPADRTYVVDEAPYLPPFPSFLINRFTFDRDLRSHNAENGVTFHPGRATGLELGRAGQPHQVVVEGEDKRKRELNCRWLIDATGRNRMLGRLLGLHHRPQLQKDVYWFRLVDFDPTILSRLGVIKKQNRAFDSYYCTHHFFGKGNWIWCIPIRSEEHPTMISIGITYRKDLCPREIRSIEQFIDHVGAEHPVVVELVRSGRVDDTNFYGSYMYETGQHYSPDGWFIIGDAGDTVDPLYSLGLTLVSFQVKQVAEIVRRHHQGEPIDEFVSDLDLALTNTYRLVTDDVNSLYEVMHDGFCCHLRMHLTILLMFHLAMPLTFSGYLSDPIGIKLFNRIVKPSALAPELGRWKSLIDAVASIPLNRAVEKYLKVQSPFSLNHKFFEHLREEEIPESISGMLFYLARLRLTLLAKTGWRGAIAFEQHLALVQDLARGGAIWAFFHGTKPRDSRLLRMLVSGPGKSPRAKAYTGSAVAGADLPARTA